MSKNLLLCLSGGTVQDEKVIEILDKYRIKATFGIDCSLDENTNYTLIDSAAVDCTGIKKSKIKDFYKKHELALAFPERYNFVECGKKEREQIISENIKTLEKYCGYKPAGIFYPCGFYNEEVVFTVKNKLKMSYGITDKFHGIFRYPKDIFAVDFTADMRNPRILNIANKFAYGEIENDTLLSVKTSGVQLERYGLFKTFEDFCRIIAENEEINSIKSTELEKYLKKQ